MFFETLLRVTVLPHFPKPQLMQLVPQVPNCHRSAHQFSCRKDKTGSPCISTPGQKIVRSQASKSQWRLLVLAKKRWQLSYFTPYKARIILSIHKIYLAKKR